MFKKPIRVKTSNRMKGSERKRLRQNVLKQFPSLSEDKLGTILPSKEDVFVTKLENANNVYITCYCLNKNPMFYEIDKEGMLYPSVYTLWQCTDLAPCMVTAPVVFEKISRGADLMLPGVISEFGGFENLRKGQIVAVKVVGNSAPVAVGVATMSTEEMHHCGMKGKGVVISHWYTDNLWSLGEKSDIPHIADAALLEALEASKIAEEKDGGMLCDANMEREAPEMKCQLIDDNNLASNASNENVPNPDVSKEDASNRDSSKEDVFKEDVSQEDVSKEDASDKEINAEINDGNDVNDIGNGIQLSPEAKNTLPVIREQMDQLLENCFYQAMLDAKKIELPILVTKFSAQYLHPACPKEQKIDVKKSKYKKMSKFLQEMESRSLIKASELSKGVLSITEMSAAHECLRTFKASLFAKEMSAAKAEAKSKEAESSAQDSLGITVVEMFAVSGKTQQFFKFLDKSKGDAMSGAEVRSMLTKYVKDNELVHQTERRKVTLDPILSDVLFDKDFREGAVTWDTLFTRFLDKMNPCHKTVINGKESRIKKGKVEPIEVKVQQRMGNKKVTLIQKLEQFGIDPSHFAHQMQLAAASSTTVSSCPDKNASYQQVLVQGNQTHLVAKLLDDLQVPKKYITGLDKLKSKAKKR